MLDVRRAAELRLGPIESFYMAYGVRRPVTGALRSGFGLAIQDRSLTLATPDPSRDR